MGYGVKPPGYWNGKKHLTWRQTEGKPHANMELAMAIWQKELGITFTASTPGQLGNAISVDFVVVNEGSQSGWSPTLKKLSLKGKETLGAMLHEVGHLLGMSHEHDRAETRADWYKNHPGAMGEKASFDGAVLRAANLQDYGAYDNDSIMQYPASKYEQMTAPSAGDIETAKAINGW